MGLVHKISERPSGARVATGATCAPGVEFSNSDYYNYGCNFIPAYHILSSISQTCIACNINKEQNTESNAPKLCNSLRGGSRIVYKMWAIGLSSVMCASIL